MAEVVPSEELRSLLLRLYSAMEAPDVDTLREMFSTATAASTCTPFSDEANVSALSRKNGRDRTLQIYRPEGP
jgi:hypothetical protein